MDSFYYGLGKTTAFFLAAVGLWIGFVCLVEFVRSRIRRPSRLRLVRPTGRREERTERERPHRISGPTGLSPRDDSHPRQVPARW